MARGLGAALAAAILLTGCAATHRALEDAAAVVTFPLHVVATPVAFFSECWESDPLSTVATAPVFLPLYVAGDVFFTGVSAVDLALTPVNAGLRAKSLGVYDFRRFPPVLRRDAAEKAGETAGAAVVILAPIVAIVLCFTGHPGECWPRDATFTPATPRYP